MTGVGPGASVIALNSGSSSLKFGFYRVESSIPKVLRSGEAESIGGPRGEVLGETRKRQAVGFRIGEFRKPAGGGPRIATLLADRDETAV
jgi:acetate kinase